MFEILNAHSLDENTKSQCRESLQKFMQRTDLGFVQLPDRTHLWDESRNIGDHLREEYKNLVVVGIGGSSLGIRVLAQVAQAQNVFIVDNVDAVEFEDLLRRVGNLKQTCWLFISKSGTTIETLLALEFIDQHHRQQKLSLAERSVVIRETKASSLSDWAQKNGVPQCEIPLDVGGRFSVLSPVGLVAAAFMGLDLEKMRQGAVAARANQILVETLMAHFVESFQRFEWISLFWYYSSRAHSLGMWLQQLWAESLGKKDDRRNLPAPRASTPMWAIGAVDQHSFLQQVMEGARDKFVLFHRFEDAEGGSTILQQSQFKETQNMVQKNMGALLKAEAIATEEALRANGISTLCLQTKVLNEESLSYYFMMFELVVAGLGEQMDINAFDQPGVELGKRLAKEILSKA